MTEIEPRTTRTQIAARQYEGVNSVGEALTDRQKMAATVEVARKARVDAREWLWNAREAERTLGRMILAAREAGDLADEGRPANGETMQTLHSLGIEPHLAAYAVQLAHVPDSEWKTWVASWREDDPEPSQAAVARSVERYRRELDEVRQRAADERARRRRLQDEQARIERELTELADKTRRGNGIEVPPLTPEDVELTGLEITARATSQVSEPPPRDVARGDRWVQAMRELEKLAAVLAADPPPLPADHFADLTVLSARDLAARITRDTAVWIRKVNAAYTERISE